MKLPPLPYEVTRNHPRLRDIEAYGLACAEAMREECAKACEQKGNEWTARNPRNQHHTGGGIGALNCAAAIRGIEVER